MVLELQLRQRPGIEQLIPVCSIAIAALLHDVCKAEVYRPEIKKRKNASGVWESYDGCSRHLGCGNIILHFWYCIFGILLCGNKSI